MNLHGPEALLGIADIRIKGYGIEAIRHFGGVIEYRHYYYLGMAKVTLMFY